MFFLFLFIGTCAFSSSGVKETTKGQTILFVCNLLKIIDIDWIILLQKVYSKGKKKHLKSEFLSSRNSYLVNFEGG